MSSQGFAPFDAPYLKDRSQVIPEIEQRGYVVLEPATVAAESGNQLTELIALNSTWNDLALDHYLKDGGRYRRRRHSCYVVTDKSIVQSPHRAHWQPLEYNALHGGMQRWFEPVSAATASSPAWTRLIHWLAALAGRLSGCEKWFVEAHQFRIDTIDGIGRPTPEGAHRDGVDFVAVFLIGRHAIKGGETRVFDANGPSGQRFTLTESWSLLLLNDARVIHESTPIQPTADGGYRDTLVITLRQGGFQGG